MKTKTKNTWLRLELWITSAITFYCCNSWADSNAIEQSVKTTAHEFHLLELYTSQGCSSCPSADITLREFIQLSDSLENGLLGLSLHVDYWNYLGWEDPYSKKQFSKRQSIHQKNIGFKSRYTPQMVINGRYECLGGDTQCIQNALDLSKQWKHPKKDYLKKILNEVQFSQTDNFIIVIHPNNVNFTMNYALIQKNEKQKITQGENSGKTLYNYNILRNLKTYPMINAGQEEHILIPKFLNGMPLEFAIWFEDLDGAVITGKRWKL